MLLSHSKHRCKFTFIGVVSYNIFSSIWCIDRWSINKQTYCMLCHKHKLWISLISHCNSHDTQNGLQFNSCCWCLIDGRSAYNFFYLFAWFKMLHMFNIFGKLFKIVNLILKIESINILFLPIRSQLIEIRQKEEWITIIESIKGFITDCWMNYFNFYFCFPVTFHMLILWSVLHHNNYICFAKTEISIKIKISFILCEI